MSFNAPQIETKLFDINKLKAAPWNPRYIKDARFKKLCESLKEDPGFMWARPILATVDGTIYGGNMRFRAAEFLGWKQVPVQIDAKLSQKLAKQRAIKDNNQFGEWQDDELAELMVELQGDGFSLSTLGFSEEKMHELLDSVGAFGEQKEEKSSIADVEEEDDGGVDEEDTRAILMVECVNSLSRDQLMDRLQSEGFSCRPVLG